MVYCSSRRLNHSNLTSNFVGDSVAAQKDSTIREYLAHATNLALRGNTVKHKVGAYIVGPNNSPTPNMTAGGWSHWSELRLTEYRTIHAEMHAIARCDPYALSGATIYLSTYRARSKTIGLAKPCLLCQALLYDVGIRDVYYTNPVDPKHDYRKGLSVNDYGYLRLT